MRSKTRVIAFGLLTLLISGVVWLDLSAHARKNGLLKMLTEKGTVILSPQDTKALLSDLNSGDKSRMEKWRSFFQMSSRAGTDFGAEAATVQDLFALYVSKEKPGRSNYFNRLVFCLRQKQKESPLPRQALLGYLGSPDYVSDGRNGQTLQYEYHYCGTHYLASVVVSNDMVIGIDIYVE